MDRGKVEALASSGIWKVLATVLAPVSLGLATAFLYGLAHVEIGLVWPYLLVVFGGPGGLIALFGTIYSLRRIFSLHYDEIHLHIQRPWRRLDIPWGQVERIEVRYIGGHEGLVMTSFGWGAVLVELFLGLIGKRSGFFSLRMGFGEDHIDFYPLFIEMKWIDLVETARRKKVAIEGDDDFWRR